MRSRFYVGDLILYEGSLPENTILCLVVEATHAYGDRYFYSIMTCDGEVQCCKWLPENMWEVIGQADDKEIRRLQNTSW